MDAKNQNRQTSFAVLAIIALSLCAIVCSSAGKNSKPAEVLQRGSLTIELYAPQSGIAHGDGTPARCVIVFKGERYTTPPGVKNGGSIFRCDLKPDSDEPVVWIAYYRPNDAWECGTRFGETRSYCLPSHYESVGGLLTVKDDKLLLEDLGFWDAQFDWVGTTLKYKNGREFNYQTWKWSGCGDEPRKTEKQNSMSVTSGMYCNTDQWCRVYFDGKEFTHPEAANHPFQTCQLNPDKNSPSAITWIGGISSLVYLSRGKPALKELPNGPDFIDEGKSVRWWSEDYQTRYTMNLKTEETFSQSRKDVQGESEKKKQSF